MNGIELEKYLQKKNKVAQEQKERAEKKTQQTFENGGYEDYVKAAETLNKTISNDFGSGNTLNVLALNDLNSTINAIQKRSAQANFTESGKASLINIAKQYQDNLKLFEDYNRLALERSRIYDQIDRAKLDIGKTLSYKNIQHSLINRKYGEDKWAQMNGKYAAPTEQEQYEARKLELKEQLDAQNAKLAPYLDINKTKTRSDREKTQRAEADRQLAYEVYHATKAEKYLKDKKVAALMKQLGASAADTEEKRALSVVNPSSQSAKEYAGQASNTRSIGDQLRQRIKELGYDGTDEDLNDTVSYMWDDAKRLETLERNQAAIAETQAFTQEHPHLASVKAATIDSIAKMLGAGYALGETVRAYTTDKPVKMDPNSIFFTGSNDYQAIVQKRKDMIKSETGKEVYELSMSMADNIARAAATKFMGPVGEGVGLGMMALNVMSDTSLELTKQGYSAEAAGSLAAVAAIAEVFTEKIGLDNLMKAVPGGQGFFKTVISTAAKQAVPEGLEEVASDVINDAADFMFEMLSDSLSQKQNEIKAIMEKEHVNVYDAFRQWQNEHRTEYLKDGFSGAVSGFLLGGGTQAIGAGLQMANRTNYKKQNAKIIKSIQNQYAEQGETVSADEAKRIAGKHHLLNQDYQSLINEGLNHSDGTVRRAAKEMQTALTYTGTVSNFKAGRLINAIQQANFNQTKGIATHMLESVNTPNNVVAAVQNVLTGGEISKSEARSIRQNENARAILEQLYETATGEQIFLNENTSREQLQEVAAAVYGATFAIDTNTNYGTTFKEAVRLRGENKIGFNGVKGFVAGYSDNMNLSPAEYSKLYTLAYDYSQAGKSKEKVFEILTRHFGTENEVEGMYRSIAIEYAFENAKEDIRLGKMQAAEEIKRRKGKKSQKGASEVGEKATKSSSYSETELAEDTSEADPVTKEAVESAKKLSRLSESEKAEKYKNGGAIVETRQELTTQQSAVISFYDYRGKKHGITYRFVDAIESNKSAKGEYNQATEVIQVRIGSVPDMTSAAGHELGHWLEHHYPADYRKMQQYLKETVFKTDLEQKIREKQASYNTIGVKLSREEAFIELTNDCLFGVDMASEDFEAFVKANESLMQKAFRVIRELLEDLQHFMEDWRKKLPGIYKKVTDIKMVQELYDDVAFMEYTADWVDGILNRNTASEQSASSEQTTDAGEQKNSTTAESGVLQYSISDDNGKVETKPASELSEKDFRDLLERAFIRRKLGRFTYIPVRANTPQFFREVIAEFTRSEEYDGEPVDIKDLPMAMQVAHVIQCMEEDDGSSYGEHRPHGFTDDEMVKIVKAMGHPLYITLQKNGRFAEVVSIRDKKNRKVLVSIDFAVDEEGKTKNYRDSIYMNGYEEGFYNIVVTQFELDDLQSYLDNNTVIYDKEKMNGKYQVGSGRIVAVAHDTPFINNSISDDDGNINKSFQISDVSNESEFDKAVNTSMTMEEAGKMVQKAFLLGENDRHYPEYKNGDEWLRGEGVDEVALNIESEYALVQRYLKHITAYNEGDIYVEDILNAYLAGTLRGQETAKIERLDVSTDLKIHDKRFYSPQHIENAKELLTVADKKAAGFDKDSVYEARAKVLLFAHNKGAAELLGITQTELNQKLRKWGRYSKAARDISLRINSNVGFSNRWTGIENCANVSQYVANKNDLAGLVDDIEGESTPYERTYITRTMLALDTHIDWSWLSFRFKPHSLINKGRQGNTYGSFDRFNSLITVSHSAGKNTVAHEMGHALDVKWAKDLGLGKEYLSETSKADERITDPQTKQFFNNFKLFIDSISDSAVMKNAYTLDTREVFARFVAKFVEWTDNIASNSFYHESNEYKDNFTSSQFIEFAKLLQEKAYLDSKKMQNAFFQISDTTLTPEQQAEIERKAQRREMAKLERENEQLKAALEYAKKQTKISKDFRHDESETARIANRLIKQLSVVDLTESEKSEFIAKLDALYTAMDDAKLENSGGSDVIYMAALDAVDVIRDSIKYTEKYEALADRAQDFADYFKGRTYISQAQAAELRHHFGGVDKANQVVHGLNFAIAKGNETTLDMRWNELQEMFSDFIEQGVTTDADEPLAVIKSMQDARELIDGTLYSPFDENRLQERAEIEELGSIYAAEQETVNDLAMKLIDSYTDAEWKATYADKAKGRQQVQLIRQRQELRQRMEKYRAQVNDRNIAFREKLQSEYRKKYDKAVSRNDVRVETEKQRLAEYKQRVAENRKKATERKRQTELKNRIKKIALELGSMAANPNKKKKIPNGLVNITHEFLSMIETGDVTQEKLNHYVASMRAEFKEVEKSHLYESVMDNYNSIIRDMLDELETGGDNLQLKQLSAEKLEKVLNIARTLKQSVSFMNKFFFVDRNRTVSDYQNSVVAERKGKVNLKPKEFLQPLKDFAINELKPVYFFENTNSPTMLKLYEGLRRGQTIWSRDMQEAKAKEKECRERYGYNQWDLRKKYKFKLAGGEAHEVELNLLQIMSLKAYSEREAGINHLLDGGFKLRSGSEQRRYVSDKFKRVIDKTAYRITEDELNQIISTLTPEQVAYCYEMREYLSTDLSKKGNEISRKMWDIELFTEEKYFPIKTDGDFNKMGELAVVDGKKLKNWGASKPLVPHAHNPLVLEEFNDVWSRHCKEMAEYHSFTLPLEDFQKVYGYFHVLTASQEKELRKNYSDEVAFEHAPGAEERKQLLGGLFEAPVATVSIRSLFSDAEQRYIAQFLRDLNGGVKKADETLPSRGISKYKKMATALNLRVTVQQPGAIARAFTYIGPKYFAMTTGSGLKGIKSDSAAVQEMEKYSDAAFIKSLGYFDIDTGRTAEQYLNENNYSTFRQKAKGFALDGEYRDEKMMFAPEMADRITWLHIWAATKAKVEAEEHLTGEALLKRAGEVFNNVVDKTQVYDSVFTRSGHMRSTSVLAKMATSFLAEPTTTLNMYVNAITQWKRGNVKKSFVAKAFASCLTATFLTNLLASVVSAMRHGKDDDNWWELWVGEFTADFLTDVTMVNSIPLVRDIFSLAKGWDVERADMTLVANWIDSVKKLNQAQQNDEVTYKEWLSFCSSSAVLLGMPLGSLQKDLFGIFQAAKVLSNGTAPTTTGFKKAIVSGVYDAATIDDMLALPQPSTNKYDMIYQLYAAGNTKEAEKRKEILFKYDDKADQNKLDNYIKAQLQENKDVMSAADALQEGDLGATKAALSKIKNFDEAIILKAVVATVNSRVDEESDEVTEDTLLKLSPQKSLEQNILLNNKTIRKAAVALNNNDDEARYNLQSQLVSQGFSVNDVINVTKQVKAKMFPSEKKKESNTKEAKLFQYTDVADALKANNATFAKKVMKDLVEAYAKEGKSEEDVKKQVRAKITATFKQEYYMANESRRAEIRILMWKSGAYDNSDAVLKVCNGWVKQIAKKKFG